MYREDAPKCNVDTYAEVGWFRPPKISKDMSTGKYSLLSSLSTHKKRPSRAAALRRARPPRRREGLFLCVERGEKSSSLFSPLENNMF